MRNWTLLFFPISGYGWANYNIFFWFLGGYCHTTGMFSSLWIVCKAALEDYRCTSLGILWIHDDTGHQQVRIVGRGTWEGLHWIYLLCARYHASCFYIILFEVVGTRDPMLELRNPVRKVNWLTWGYTDRNWWDLDSNAICLTPEPCRQL